MKLKKGLVQNDYTKRFNTDKLERIYNIRISNDRETDVFQTKFDVKKHRDSIKELAPSAISAYKNPKKCPPKALAFMLAGGLIWIAGGVLMTIIIVNVGKYILDPVMEFARTAYAKVQAGEKYGLITLFSFLGGLVIAMLESIGLFIIAGTCSAITVKSFGDAGKNRSRWIPMVISVFSSIFIVSFTFAYFHGKNHHIGHGLEVLLFEIRENICLLLLFVPPVAFAVFYFFLDINLYCKECDVAMVKHKFNRISLSATQLIREALNRGELQDSLAVLSYKGKLGEPVLFRCPKCGRGLFEVNIDYTIRYRNDEGKIETKNEFWRTVSKLLSKADADEFLKVSDVQCK